MNHQMSASALRVNRLFSEGVDGALAVWAEAAPTPISSNVRAATIAFLIASDYYRGLIPTRCIMPMSSCWTK